jgi:NhaP-type Na+/H+ or K+/H+ antiporter
VTSPPDMLERSEQLITESARRESFGVERFGQGFTGGLAIGLVLGWLVVKLFA